jgi:hypothetical protein
VCGWVGGWVLVAVVGFLATIGIRVIGLRVIRSSHITELNLQRCGMTGDSLPVLLPALHEHGRVVALDISHNQLQKSGMEALTDFLKVNQSLKHLHMRECSLVRKSQLCMLLLTYVLRKSQCVTCVLHVSHMCCMWICWLQAYTSKKVALGFSDAVSSNTSLVTLDLRANSLSAAFVTALSRTMREKRPVVPWGVNQKACFLLCNRRQPVGRQLPEPACAHLATADQLVGY